MMRVLAVVACVLGLLWPSTGAAHERSTSQGSVRFEGDDARLELSVSARELDALLGASSPADERGLRSGEYATAHLRVASEGGPCSVLAGSLRRLDAPPGRIVWEWTARCPAPAKIVTIESHLFDAIAPHHLLFLRVAQGTAVVTQVLAEGHGTATVDRSAFHSEGGASAYVKLGVEHILTGYDHLAFLLALLVVAASFGEVARVVTGFTIGHSATLALAALGWLHPDARLVEATIGVSIAVVASENAWTWSGRRGVAVPGAAVLVLVVTAALEASRAPRAAWALLGMALAVGCYFALARRATAPAALRGAIASAFGLVHGLGFAASFAEQPVPTGHVVSALLGFNVGVELGQLAVGGLAWGALRALQTRRPGAHRWIAPAASAAAGGAGVYWMLTRLG